MRAIRLCASAFLVECLFWCACGLLEGGDGSVASRSISRSSSSTTSRRIRRPAASPLLLQLRGERGNMGGGRMLRLRGAGLSDEDFVERYDGEWSDEQLDRPLPSTGEDEVEEEETKSSRETRKEKRELEVPKKAAKKKDKAAADSVEAIDPFGAGDSSDGPLDAEGGVVNSALASTEKTARGSEGGAGDADKLDGSDDDDDDDVVMPSAGEEERRAPRREPLIPDRLRRDRGNQEVLEAKDFQELEAFEQGSEDSNAPNAGPGGESSSISSIRAPPQQLPLGEYEHSSLAGEEGSERGGALTAEIKEMMKGEVRGRSTMAEADEELDDEVYEELKEEWKMDRQGGEGEGEGYDEPHSAQISEDEVIPEVLREQDAKERASMAMDAGVVDDADQGNAHGVEGGVGEEVMQHVKKKGPTPQDIAEMKKRLMTEGDATLEDGSPDDMEEKKNRLWRIGGIYHGYGDYDEALSYYERALKMWVDNFGEDNDDVAIMTFAIGTIHKTLSKWDKALKLFQRSLRIKKMLWGDDDMSTKLTGELLQECLGEKHDWEIKKNMYDPYNDTPNSWIDLGVAELDLSESEMDPESPRYVDIP